MRLPWRRGERASSLDLLVVGLGNPGREYAGNRHNVGHMVVEELARRHDGSWRDEVQRPPRRGADRLAPRRRCSRPRPYMNESGRSVKAAAQFFKVEPDAILIVHDESDLELGGSRRAWAAGSPATTASARSRSSSARRTSCACASASAGPGRGDRRPLADWVLSDFEPDEDPEALVARAADAVESLDAEGLEATQRQFN